MFVWDSTNIAHIARHTISPDEAEQVFDNDPLDLGRLIRNGEERILHLGETRGGRILHVVTTVRGELVRVVTAYPAGRPARKFYLSKKG